MKPSTETRLTPVVSRGLWEQIQLGKAGHLKRGLARTVRGRSVSIRSLEDYPVDVQVDGDCVLQTPITCRAAGSTVSILVPRENRNSTH